MQTRLRTGLITVVLLLPIGLGANPRQEPSGATRKPDAAKLKNPIPSDAKSIAEGRQLFTKLCISCHGATAKGDGRGGALLKPKPADLTDAEWKHGSTDG